MANWYDIPYNEQLTDKKGEKHSSMNPLFYDDLTAYLEKLITCMMPLSTSTETIRDRVLNIMAVRTYFKVKGHNKDALDSTQLQDSTNPPMAEIAKGVAEKHLELINSRAAQEYLESKQDFELQALVDGNTHGGRLERDFAKFVCTHKGPILTDTPPRYMPHALTRIDELKKQLKGLDRNAPEYATRAKEICMDILATRAAVNSTRGDKSSLKKSYDPAVCKRHYDGLMESVGKNLSADNLDRLVRGALKTPGHGGTMESIAQELVRLDMQGRALPNLNVPERYQLTNEERAQTLSNSIGSFLHRIKMGEKLEDFERANLKQALAEAKVLDSIREGQLLDKKPHARPLRIGDKEFSMEKAVERAVNDPAMDKLIDRLERCEDQLDKLDAATRGGSVDLETVSRIVRTEGDRLAEEQAEAGMSEEDRNKKYVLEDLKVEDMNGSDISRNMKDTLSAEVTKIIQTDRWIEDADNVRKLRVICDKRMAIQYAYSKCMDPKTKLVDEQKFARELNGKRFEQNIKMVRQDPVYQRMMQDMADPSKNNGSNFAKEAQYAAMSPSDGLFNRFDKTVEVMKQEAAQQQLNKKIDEPVKQSGNMVLGAPQ